MEAVIFKHTIIIIVKMSQQNVFYENKLLLHCLVGNDGQNMEKENMSFCPKFCNTLCYTSDVLMASSSY